MAVLSYQGSGFRFRAQEIFSEQPRHTPAPFYKSQFRWAEALRVFLNPERCALLLKVLSFVLQRDVAFEIVFLIVIEVAIAGSERCGREHRGRSGYGIAVLVDLHAQRQTHL